MEAQAEVNDHRNHSIPDSMNAHQPRVRRDPHRGFAETTVLNSRITRASRTSKLETSTPANHSQSDKISDRTCLKFFEHGRAIGFHRPLRQMQAISNHLIL